MATCPKWPFLTDHSWGLTVLIILYSDTHIIMLEKVGQRFCSDWFHRSNEGPVKISDMEAVNGLQYFCKTTIISIPNSLTRTPTVSHRCWEQGGSSKFDGGGSSQNMGGAWGELKMSKNTCEGVNLIVKLPAITRV